MALPRVRPWVDNQHQLPSFVHGEGVATTKMWTRGGNSRRSTRRASLFRRHQQYQRVLELIDEHGNHSQHALTGRMNITSHLTVLLALEARANCFKGRGRLSTLDDKLLSSALDETGTVDYICNNENMYGISDECEQLALLEQQQIKELVNELGISDETLQIHGLFPNTKGEGITRLIYENANGISSKLMGNDKVEKAKSIHDELGVYIVAYNEHRLNMRHKGNVNGFNQLFQGGEAAIQSVVSHNTHGNISKIQEGGTSLMMFGPITDQLDYSAVKRDDSGLGR